MITCRTASTKDEREAILRQRHDVFVEELNFFIPREDGVPIEHDQYDDHAVFLGIWEKSTLIGSCRLILPNASINLPTLKAMDIDIKIFEPSTQTAEISRMTVIPPHRTLKKSIQALKAIDKEVNRIANMYNIVRLIAAVEPTFLRLLEYAKLGYRLIGSPQKYTGLYLGLDPIEKHTIPNHCPINLKINNDPTFSKESA